MFIRKTQPYGFNMTDFHNFEFLIFFISSNSYMYFFMYANFKILATMSSPKRMASSEVESTM